MYLGIYIAPFENFSDLAFLFVDEVSVSKKPESSAETKALKDKNE